ncbi:Cholesterol 7-alpha-monooxygenase [Madurella mycetomatis]|uniref:Cholesterol 7-alpha-monooxygenase n=1 Tax=Madurella mycetomatis TaxID=100816 RepID=A0A175WEJ1_9PEZI|nr:Cholesterol 7-alpha-monooxygenase [Madurella mycetomatis]
MESIESLAEQVAGLSRGSITATVIASLAALIVFVVFITSRYGPPSLFDPIPFLFNTTQFIFYNDRFMKRVSKALKKSRIVRFRLFTTPVFMVSGSENIQAIFSHLHKVGSEDLFEQNVFPVLYCMSKDEVGRFTGDKSGRGRQPAPGTEHVPVERRYWFGYHHVHSEYLGRTESLQPIAASYHRGLSLSLDERYTVGEWTTVSIIEFCRYQVAECAIAALFGPGILELNPGLIDAFWEFDSNISALTLALPRWLSPKSYRAKDRYYGMIGKHVGAARASFDWGGKASEADWEPMFGARIIRELFKWFRDAGFHDEVAIGALGMLLFALNSNTIPTTMWMIIKIVQDPSLLQAIREEVATACVMDEKTGSSMLDLDKLTALPLLQSVFTEVLRLHMNFNLIRYVHEPIALDGFVLPKGCMLQAPMLMPHHDEEVWGRTGHAASEFWAERHIKHIEEPDGAGGAIQRRIFSMAGRPSSYYPFGGGHDICPGRRFAKHEIFTTIALLILKFDIEVIGWARYDGTPSDRPARPDCRFSGVGAMPPDRDLRLRWRRKM